MTTRASAYVHRGRLCIVGVHEHKLGPVPFAVSVTINGTEPEGPLDVGAKLSDPLVEALEQARDKVKQIIEKGRLELAAENLVLRSRQGDQNAMAILVGVKKNARKGIPKAKRAFSVIQRFMSDNPSETSFGLEQSIEKADSPLQYNAYIVALGPSLNACRVICMLANRKFELEELAQAVEGDLEASFRLGVYLSKHPNLFSQCVEGFSREDFDAAKIGFLAGRAKLLQSVREGGPISNYCRVTGWELGE